MPPLEIIEVVLINFIIVNSNYQQGSKVMDTLVPNKLFGQLLVLPENFILLRTFD